MEKEKKQNGQDAWATVINCLVNSRMKTVSSCLGSRKQTRWQVMDALKHAFEKLKSELATTEVCTPVPRFKRPRHI